MTGAKMQISMPRNMIIGSIQKLPKISRLIKAKNKKPRKNLMVGSIPMRAEVSVLSKRCKARTARNFPERALALLYIR